MDSMWILLALFVIAIPFIGFIIAMALRGRVGRLEAELASLRTTVLAVQNVITELAKLQLKSGDEPQSQTADTPKANRAKSINQEKRSEPIEPVEPNASASSSSQAQGETADNNRFEASSAAIPTPAFTKPAKRRSAADLEKMIGARWSVILGGIAIALGAVFLVRYSIEAGLLGPAARIAMGTLLSAALFAGGEFLRRRDQQLNLPVFEKADIPGILTGVGSIAAFATLYAAHALYGFVGPGFAFVGLTLIGLASLVLSSIHGPKLAAIGVLGAYATPLLVSSDAPNPIALAIHVLVVTASVMGIARLRGWLWLAFAGIIGGTGWTILGALSGGPDAALAGAMLLVGLAIIYSAAFGWQIEERPDPLEDRPTQRVAVLAFLALAIGFFVQLAFVHDLPEIVTGLMLALVMTGAAIIWPALASVSLIASFCLILAAIAHQLPIADLPGMTQEKDIIAGLVPPDITSFLQNMFLLALPPSALALYGGYRASFTAPRMAGWLATSISITAFFVLLFAYLRIAPFETRSIFGMIALGLAAVFAVLAETFTRSRPDDLKAPAPAAFAVACVSLVSFAIAVSFSKGWMPLGFALASAGIAAVWIKRPLVAISWLAVAAAVLSGIALYFNAPFPSLEIGTTPFFNNLITLVGLPSAAMIFGGLLMRWSGGLRPGAAITAIGLAALGLFVGLELRHWLSGGDIDNSVFGLADMASQAIAALCFAIGLQRLAKFTSDTLFDKAALVAGGIGALMIGFGLFLSYNPLINYQLLGEGRVFNLLFPAYLVTGVLAAIVALMARPIRPRWYTLAYASLSGLLLFGFATMLTRHFYQGTNIQLFRSTSDQEFWTYSAVWLLLGAGVLALGLWLKSLPVRIASGLLIALTICKVFLFDLASLTGALRAFSFLGLGASLLIIGRFYQSLIIGAHDEDEEENQTPVDDGAIDGNEEQPERDDKPD